MKMINKLLIMFAITPLLYAEDIGVDSIGVNAGCMNISAKKTDEVGSVTFQKKPNKDFLQAEMYALLRGVFKEKSIFVSINYLHAQNSDFTNDLLMSGIKKYFTYNSFNPYFGGYVGYGQLSGKYYPFNVTKKESSSSLVGAVEVGSEYKLSENFSIGLNARYYFQDYRVRMKLSPTTFTEVSHPTACSLSLGIRYRFGASKRVEEEQHEPKELRSSDFLGKTVQVKKVKEDQINVIPDDILVMGDADQDGVFDFKDACLGTPNGFIVDANGCAKSAILYIKFAQNSTKIPSVSESDINTVVNFMQRHRNQKVHIIGYSSRTAVSNDAYNLKLSKKRADIFKAKLVKRGINPKRITTEGRGFHKPLVSNATKEGRAKNRRLEIEFLKSKEF